VKKLFVLMAVAVLLLAASCDSKNQGPDWPQLKPSQIQITTPTGMLGNANADWSVTWISNNGPFTVAWDFGNGANPNTVTGTATTNTGTATVQMLNATEAAASYTVTVTITDSKGRFGTATGTYSVGPIPNHAPTIASAVFTAATKALVVTVNDEDDAEALNVTVTVPTGLTVDAATKAASQTGPLTATFNWNASDMITGGSGTTTVTVTDSVEATATTTAVITIDPLPLDPDTIYAIPMVNTAVQTDTPTILVATGIPASPFKYLVSANVTFPTWVHYTANSFNIGAVGGAIDAADGFWGTGGMNLNNGDFLLGNDSFLLGKEKADMDGVTGRHRLQFNVTPLTDDDVTTAKGMLFNFNVTLDQAGSASFGFIATMPLIDRTLYRDADGGNHFWGTLSAGPDGTLTDGVTGINNVIVVN
jgi:hypothetical protein